MVASLQISADCVGVESKWLALCEEVQKSDCGLFGVGPGKLSGLRLTYPDFRIYVCLSCEIDCGLLGTGPRKISRFAVYVSRLGHVCLSCEIVQSAESSIELFADFSPNTVKSQSTQ